MDLFSGAEKMMTMDDRTWLRHASPWSVWTRFFTMIPLLSLAIWSRVLIGWYALIPLALTLAWVWYNPRAFPPPASTDHWGSRGTFGERIFLERRKTDLPAHHLRAAMALTGVTFAASLVWIWGLYALDFWATVAGGALVVVSKAWFVDRMVWIYQDMKDSDPRYAGWLR